MKIYLGDLAYLQENDSNQPVPLNVAYLATYVQKHVDGIEVEIFRDPRTLLDRIDAMPPDLLGLSHYDWNANLNMDVLRHCREVSPATFTVMGGPRFDYDDNEWISEFFRARPALDAYVAKEGEYSFRIIPRYVSRYDDIHCLEYASPSGIRETHAQAHEVRIHADNSRWPRGTSCQGKLTSGRSLRPSG